MALSLTECAPDAVDYCIIQGNSFEVNLELTDDVGAAQDITGWVFTAQIRKKYADDSPPLASFTETARNNTGGTVTLRLEAADTEAIPRSKDDGDLYRWDVEADDTVNVTTLCAGDVLVVGETTRLGD